MHRWAHTSAYMVAKKTVTSYSIATIYEYWLEGHERHVFIFVQYIYHNKLHRVIHAGMNPPSNLATGGQAGSGSQQWIAAGQHKKLRGIFPHGSWYCLGFLKCHIIYTVRSIRGKWKMNRQGYFQPIDGQIDRRYKKHGSTSNLFIKVTEVMIASSSCYTSVSSSFIMSSSQSIKSHRCCWMLLI